MITSRKISQVNVFTGSPWEVASVKRLLNAAYIEASMKDKGLNSINYGPMMNAIQLLCVLSAVEFR